MTILKLKHTLLPVMVCVLAACGSNHTETATTEAATTVAEKQFILDKLVGTWQGYNGGSYERWAKLPDGSYTSAVYELKGADTVFNEQAHIYKENEKWIFENNVAGQNNGTAVKFTAETYSDNSIQFSNPAHDFPNHINYTVPNNATVNAFIVGKNEKGGFDTIPFNYRRIK